MPKQEMNDDKGTVWLEKMCSPNNICNIFYRDQLETLHFSICHSLRASQRIRLNCREICGSRTQYSKLEGNLEHSKDINL